MPMIVGEIRRYLREDSPLKVGRATKDLAYRALSARETLSKDAIQEPTTAQIAQLLGEPESAVADALDAISDPVSLYEPCSSSDGEEYCRADRIADSDSDLWLDNLALKDALRSCTPRERQIIALRYYDGKTQTEAAEEIGVSQAQISRIEKTALEKLKKQLS